MKMSDREIIDQLNRIYDAQAAGGVAPAFADITGDPSENTNLATALLTKQTEAQVQTIADAKVSDTAYNAGTWDAVTGIAPSKNAVRDKFDSVDTAITAAVSDTAYDATSWDGVTTIAPSKNAVRDKIEAVVASIPPAHSGGVIGTAVITIDNGDAVTVDYADGILAGAASGQFVYTSASGTLVVSYIGDGGAQNFPDVTWESSVSLTRSISAVSATGFTATFLNSTTGLSAGTAVDVARITVSKLSQ